MLVRDSLVAAQDVWRVFKQQAAQRFSEARCRERHSQAHRGPSYLVISALAALYFISAESTLFKRRSRNTCQFACHTGLAARWFRILSGADPRLS